MREQTLFCFIYATAKSEFNNCSNKHETGLVDMSKMAENNSHTQVSDLFLLLLIWPRGYKTSVQSQTQNKAQ